MDRRPLLAAFGACTAFALVCIATLEQGFVTSDDAMQLLVASGHMVGGEPSPYTLYSNVLAMVPVSFLLARFPAINWYTLQLVVVHLLASVAIAYTLLRCGRRRWAWILLAFMLVSFEGRFLVDLQFTHAATAAAAAGLALLLIAGESRDPLQTGMARGFSWRVALAGIGLATWGSLIRPEGFLVALAPTTPVLAFVVLSRRDRRLVLALLLTFTLVGGAVVLDRMLYASDPAWSDFREFRPAQGRLLNGHHGHRLSDVPGIDAVRRLQDALNDVGWSHTDWELFVGYRFMSDPQAFRTPAIAALGDRLVVRRSPAEMMSYLWAQKSSFAYLPAIVLIALLPLFGGCRGARSGVVRHGKGVKWRQWIGDPCRDRDAYVLAAFGVAAATAVFVFYLVWAARLPRHVRLPLVYSVAVLAVVGASRLAPQWSNRVKLPATARMTLLVSLAMATALSAVILHRDVRINLIDRRAHEAIVKTLLSDQEAVYLHGNFEYLRTFRPWRRLDRVRHHLLPVTEFARSPLARAGLQEIGVASVIEAIAQNRVRVIGKLPFLHLLAEHMGARYGVAVRPRILAVVGSPPSADERDKRVFAARFEPDR